MIREEVRTVSQDISVLNASLVFEGETAERRRGEVAEDCCWESWLNIGRRQGQEPLQLGQCDLPLVLL